MRAVTGSVAFWVVVGCGDVGGENPLSGPVDMDTGESSGTGAGAVSTAGAGSDDTASTSGSSSPSTDDATSHSDSEATGSTDDGQSTGLAEDTDATEGGEDTGDDAGSLACATLEACCDEIGPDLYPGCMTVVQMDSPALCDQIMTTYLQEGYCTGETYCLELAACCPDLPPGPGWQETCDYYADFGNQPQCAMLIGDYQLSGYCF